MTDLDSPQITAMPIAAEALALRHWMISPREPLALTECEQLLFVRIQPIEVIDFYAERGVAC